MGRSGIFFIPRDADRCPQSPHQPDQARRGKVTKVTPHACLAWASTWRARIMPCENGENGYAAMGVGLTGRHAGGWLGVGVEPAERRWRKCIAATRV